MEKQSSIPRTIYQTWCTTELDTDMQRAVDSWKNLNPNYSHKLFTDEMCREYIRDHFHPRVLQAYDILIPKAFKADLWRYCILYREGGVYANIDSVLIKPLDTFLEGPFVGVRDRQPGSIYQGFIASEAGHPFLREAIDRVVWNVETRFYGTDKLEITGPDAFGQVIYKYSNINSTSCISIGNSYFPHTKIHIRILRFGNN